MSSGVRQVGCALRRPVIPVHGGNKPFWVAGVGTRTHFAASCVGARQYPGSAGKITNCQIGAFAACLSVRGHAFIDRALYLPKSWTGDPARLAATHVPEAIAFATKPGLAVDMIRRAMAADVPFSWVAEDAVYGVGDVEGTLRRACKSYVLGVKSDHYFGSWSGKPPVAGTAQEIARDLDPSASQRLSAGEGTKGARLHDWAYCELADLDADEYTETKSGLWARGLLIRRNTSDGDLAFITTWCLDGTGIQTLVSVKGHRRAIEDSFETAKNELGPDHNETRSCHGWHHHASLVMLAFAIMAVIRCRTNDVTPQKRLRMPTIRI
ncbi:IS701 family transposase [Shinella sp. DD12]|uniref:IS701 family transposase n=1 Tax=Shinella sp. DD12 TaxID=1410620 RepID=UPI0009DECAD8|nr:IS701 family transposase [Shinella sp. DD12]MCA0338918.1 IS701 family transposase [Pseudomonadota bacterium]